MTTDAKTGETDVDVVTDAEDVSTAPEGEASVTEADSAAPAANPDPKARRGRRRRMRGLPKGTGVILLVLALLVSAGATAWLYFTDYRPDQQTNADAARVAIDAATAGSIALLSYSPESLDKDFAAAKSHLTGDFLNYYTQFTEQIVTPAAKQKSVKTSASVVQAAVSELHPDTAVVLVFINQVTTSKENPDGAFAASAVKVGLKKVDGRWLIEAFDPV